MKITMIGTGYVGLVTGACLAEVGNDVLCLDVDARKIEHAEARRHADPRAGARADDPPQHGAGRLRFTTDIAPRSRHGTSQFIAVGTPPDEDGTADLQYVLQAARNIGRRMDPVDAGGRQVHGAGRHRRTVREAIAEELAARGADIPFAVVSNPEFLKEGAAVEDFMRPDRIVIGADDDRAIAALRELYAPFQRNHERLLVMDLRSAELTKYAANAMLATRISFMNELANLAERLGADIEHVRQGIGSDPRIGYHFLYPGAGYGGCCFPKDVQGAAVHRAAQHGLPLQAARAQSRRSTSAEAGAGGQDRRALRRRPDRAAFRALGARLQAQYRRHARGAQARDHRRARSAAAPRRPPTIRWRWTRRGGSTGDAPGVASPSRRIGRLDGADALVIVTEWKEFRSPDFDAAAAHAEAAGDLRRPQSLRTRRRARRAVSSTMRSDGDERRKREAPMAPVSPPGAHSSRRRGCWWWAT